MPNIFLSLSQKETCPGKGIPVVALSVMTSSVLDSVSGPYLEKTLQILHSLLVFSSFPCSSQKKFRSSACALPLLFFLLSLFFPSFSSFFLSLLMVMLSSNPVGQLSSANHRREKAIRDAEAENKKPSHKPAGNRRQGHSTICGKPGVGGFAVHWPSHGSYASDSPRRIQLLPDLSGRNCLDPSSFVYGRHLRFTEYELPSEVPKSELTVQVSEDPTAAGYYR
jgi:hypothetical protein